MNLSFPSLSTFTNQSTDNMNAAISSSFPHAELTSAPPSEAKAEHGCLVYEQEGDSGESVISKQAYLWITTVISTGVMPLLFLVGVPGNLLAAAVFYKQGLRERINFCIFCLALVDLVVISADFLIEAEGAYRDNIGSMDIFARYIVGLTGFTWVSMFLSAVIASERCFCVVSPLRAQRMLSTCTLAFIIICVSLVLLSGMFVIAGPKHIEVCLFDPKTNSTSYIVYVTEFYLQNKEILDPIDIFFYAMALPIIFIVVIVFTTIITTVKLRSASKWRRQSSSGTQTAGGLDSQMVGLTNMLIVASVLFVVCQIPVLIVQMGMFWVPELKYGGQYHHLMDALWGFNSMFRSVNSSLNFFVYYKMGSRFRQTLKELLSCKKVKLNTSVSDYVDSFDSSRHSKQRAFSQSGNDRASFQ